MHVRSTKKVAGRTVAMASLSPSSRLSQNSDIPLPPSRAPIPTVELTSQDRICIQFASLATLRSARSLGHNESIRIVATSSTTAASPDPNQPRGSKTAERLAKTSFRLTR